MINIIPRTLQMAVRGEAVMRGVFNNIREALLPILPFKTRKTLSNLNYSHILPVISSAFLVSSSF